MQAPPKWNSISHSVMQFTLRWWWARVASVSRRTHRIEATLPLPGTDEADPRMNESGKKKKQVKGERERGLIPIQGILKAAQKANLKLFNNIPSP